MNTTTIKTRGRKEDGMNAFKAYSSHKRVSQSNKTSREDFIRSLKAKKCCCCAVCGDTTALNMHGIFQRDSDGKKFVVCSHCRETGKVNANSVDNYKQGAYKD